MKKYIPLLLTILVVTSDYVTHSVPWVWWIIKK